MELLTKDIIAPARNNASAPAFFLHATESDKLALFTRQIELLSVFDFPVDNKPISLNIDDLLSHFILTDRYLCDFLRSCKHIALEINENFHEFIAGRELTALSTLAALVRSGWMILVAGEPPSRCWRDSASIASKWIRITLDKENDPALPGLLQSIHTLTGHVIVEVSKPKSKTVNHFCRGHHRSGPLLEGRIYFLCG